MKCLIALLFVALVAIAPARAALVYDGYPTDPGGFSTPYTAVNPEVYAGVVGFNHGSTTVLAMSDDYNTRVNVGDSWLGTLYTYADVMAGAPVRFDPVKYSQTAWMFAGPWWSMFRYQMNNGGVSQRELDHYVNVNIAIWSIMNPGSVLFPNPSDSFYQNGEAQLFYDLAIDGTHDNYDWSNVMIVATPNGPGGDEYLIPLIGQNITIANAPLPTAFWLLGSGLLGLAGVARKRHGAPR